MAIAAAPAPTAVPERPPASLEVIADRTHRLMQGVHPAYLGHGQWENRGSKLWNKLEKLVTEGVLVAGYFDAEEDIHDIVYPVTQTVIDEIIRRVHESGRASA